MSVTHTTSHNDREDKCHSNKALWLSSGWRWEGLACRSDYHCDHARTKSPNTFIQLHQNFISVCSLWPTDNTRTSFPPYLHRQRNLKSWHSDRQAYSDSHWSSWCQAGPCFHDFCRVDVMIFKHRVIGCCHSYSTSSRWARTDSIYSNPQNEEILRISAMVNFISIPKLCHWPQQQVYGSFLTM